MPDPSRHLEVTLDLLERAEKAETRLAAAEKELEREKLLQARASKVAGIAIGYISSGKGVEFNRRRAKVFEEYRDALAAYDAQKEKP